MKQVVHELTHNVLGALWTKDKKGSLQKNCKYFGGLP